MTDRGHSQVFQRSGSWFCQRLCRMPVLSVMLARIGCHIELHLAQHHNGKGFVRAVSQGTRHLAAIQLMLGAMGP